ncbi:NF-kappa-B-repressing factor-like [Coccinella septempunctata]|uniref:NF-kappa-B-repressing factor-like n=1 Tax=Coccinella septempunctata TaxID=41139 RepID=UPI001D098B73|nr:NF-kappa-B-repressing factor-like [Coccinella septempunctata]
METKSKYIDLGIKFVKSAESSSTSSVLSNYDPEKCDALVDAVFNQPGIRGQLIIYDAGTSDNPIVVLQNSLSVLELQTTVSVDHRTLEYNFFIGNELICSSGKRKFCSKNEAKHELAKDALELLKKDCFVLVRNRHHTDITEDDLMKKYESPLISESDFNKPGSAAHNIMLKMGWQGGGLGSMQQGRVDNIQVYENVDRQGLGNKNIMKEVTKILREFSNSNKFTILAFDSSFTKSEREAIHKTARRLNLKSKSEGKQDERRITVSRKINRSDIVRELLKAGGESSSYILKIPENFKYFKLK